MSTPRACEFCGATEKALNAGGAQLYECEVKNCGRLCCADCSSEGAGNEETLDVVCDGCGEAP